MATTGFLLRLLADGFSRPSIFAFANVAASSILFFTLALILAFIDALGLTAFGEFPPRLWVRRRLCFFDTFLRVLAIYIIAIYFSFFN
jgi:hypothetical protein